MVSALVFVVQDGSAVEGLLALVRGSNGSGEETEQCQQLQIGVHQNPTPR